MENKKGVWKWKGREVNPSEFTTGAAKVAEKLKETGDRRKYPMLKIRAMVGEGKKDYEIANACQISIESARRFIKELNGYDG